MSRPPHLELCGHSIRCDCCLVDSCEMWPPCAPTSEPCKPAYGASSDSEEDDADGSHRRESAGDSFCAWLTMGHHTKIRRHVKRERLCALSTKCTAEPWSTKSFRIASPIASRGTIRTAALTCRAVGRGIGAPTHI